MKPIERRLANIERAVSMGGSATGARLFLVEGGPTGDGAEAFLRAKGRDLTPDDIVVVLVAADLNGGPATRPFAEWRPEPGGLVH